MVWRLKQLLLLLGPGENGLPFDPANLPAIESIGADSNNRDFLEAGVPEDLARAALRRVWSLDPAIRDFVGLSENSWGFNAPGAMDGFGPIDGLGRILSRLLGKLDNNTASVHTPIMPPTDDSPDSAAVSGPVERHATSAESLRLVLPKGRELDLDEIDVADDMAHLDRDVVPRSEFLSSRRRALCADRARFVRVLRAWDSVLL
jgi:hypothetical protein